MLCKDFFLEWSRLRMLPTSVGKLHLSLNTGMQLKACHDFYYYYKNNYKIYKNNYNIHYYLICFTFNSHTGFKIVTQLKVES